MNPARFTSLGIIILAGCLALGLLFSPLSRATAQEPQPGRPDSPNAPQAMLGSAFTYQGQLIKSGVPYTGVCNVRFSIWDAPTLGSMGGGYSTVSGVTVTNGLFTATANAGGEFGAQAFAGIAPYLQVEVQCSGDGGYTALTPRQPITGAPYALGLRPGLLVESSTPGSLLELAHTAGSGLNQAIWAQTASTGGRAIYGRAVSTTGANVGIWGESSSNQGIGMVGLAAAGTGFTTGVYGESKSDAGTGVFGFSESATGTNYGVYGLSYSSNGYGVYGSATAVTGITTGVYGINQSTSGYGVHGVAANSVGFSHGVYGETFSAGGSGVSGFAYSSTGFNYGVYGESSSNSGVGVEGIASATLGVAYGVRGTSQSSDGIGVIGTASATDGLTYGVIGQAFSPFGTGVSGLATSTTGITYGVFGQSYAPAGMGVYGYASATSGVNYGVKGASLSSAGYGGSFENLSYGVALRAHGNGQGRNNAALSVGNTNAVQGMAGYLVNNSNFATTHFYNAGTGEVLYLQNGGLNAAGAGGGDFIRAVNNLENDVQFRVDTIGNVMADGTFSSPAADFAELLAAVPGLEAGDVLAIGPEGKLVKASQPYQSSLAGVYSTQPAFLGGAADDRPTADRIPLAVVGVVPVKVSAENGPIQPGDLLTTSSTPGFAMKASPLTVQGVSFYPSGAILGKALGGLSFGQGVILVLLILH